MVDRFGDLEETCLDEVDDTPCYSFVFDGEPVKVTMEDYRVFCGVEGVKVKVEEAVRCIKELVNPDFII
jgi:hypothetical protein